jgi:hypothetical protein
LQVVVVKIFTLVDNIQIILIKSLLIDERTHGKARLKQNERVEDTHSSEHTAIQTPLPGVTEVN